MNGSNRLRRLASYAIVAALAVAAISCNEAHPNSTLTPHSDLGREIDFLGIDCFCSERSSSSL